MASTTLDQLVRYRCPNCGVRVGETDPVCKSCGIGMKPVGASEQEQEQVAEHQEEIAEIEKGHRRQKRQAKKAEEETVAKTATAARGRKETGSGKGYTPTPGTRMRMVWDALKKGTLRVDIAQMIADADGMELGKAKKKLSQYLSLLRKEKGIGIEELTRGPNKGKLKIK